MHKESHRMGVPEVFESEMSEVQEGALESDILINHFLNYILTG